MIEPTPISSLSSQLTVDSDIINIIIGVDDDSFHDAVHLVLSTRVLFFNSWHMSANISPLFLNQIGILKEHGV
jgi:hypothetical protein